MQGGDIFTFSAQLSLVPDQDLGIFVTYNIFDDQFREITSGVITLALPDSERQPSPAHR